MTSTTTIWQKFAASKLYWKDKQIKSQFNYPAYVITGCNPHGKLASHRHNRLYHNLLHGYLCSEFPDAIITEVVGYSVNEDWEEVSWAISGPAINDIILVAQLFRQLAFFKINDCCLEVIDANDNVAVSTILRSSCDSEDTAVAAAQAGESW